MRQTPLSSDLQLRRERGGINNWCSTERAGKTSYNLLEPVGIEEVVFALDLQGWTRFEHTEHSVHPAGTSWAKMQ